MEKYTLAVAQREVGTLPLSVGTSMAIELFTDRKDPDQPQRTLPKPQPPEELWVNIRTLFRNLYNAIDPELRKKVLPDHFVPTLITELEQIKSIVEEQSLGLTKVIFYHCSYTDLTTRFPKAVHKPLKTDLQKIYFAMEQGACGDVVEKMGEVYGIKKFVSRLTGNLKKVWLLTHVPLDLVSTERFVKVTLLESHTGKLKEKLDWNSKLSGGDKTSHLPFNTFTLQVFGDGSLFFSPMPLAIKKEVLDISMKYNWTPATTMDKIRYGIGSMTDHFGRTWLMSLAR